MLYPLKQAYHLLLHHLPPQRSAELSVVVQFFRAHGTIPNLRRPRTFNEKVQYRKLYENNPRFEELVDKIRVKDFIRKQLGEDWVIPALWSGTTLPARSERSWPLPFVIKSNHGSGWNYFVRTEADRDWAKIEELCHHWLKTPWPREKHEEFYNKFERQILVEKMLGSPEGSLIDYKFFVFRGKTHLVQVDIDRRKMHKRVFYDRNWVRQNLQVMYPLDLRDIERPRHFRKMLAVAELLGREFSFVRIDFYDLTDGPKFGEFTFAPNSGLRAFQPRAYDRMLGDLWDHITTTSSSPTVATNTAASSTMMTPISWPEG